MPPCTARWSNRRVVGGRAIVWPDETDDTRVRQSLLGGVFQAVTFTRYRGAALSRGGAPHPWLGRRFGGAREVSSVACYHGRDHLRYGRCIQGLFVE